MVDLNEACNNHSKKRHPFQMKIRTVNHKFHLLTSKKHTFSRASQEAEHKKSGHTLHLGTKAKYVIVCIIIVIMIGSIFAVLQNASPSTPPNIVPESSDNPTGGPSPTNQQTPGATKTPYTNPSSTGNPHGPWIGPEPTPTPIAAHPPGTIAKAQVMNRSVWAQVANEVWAYFQSGTGVDPNTGLPGAVSGYPYFTDWDLGVYIQAVLDAQKLGLISKDGDWGADYRFDKVLNFLETRPLNETTNYPFWFYQAGDSKNYEPQSNLATVKVDAVDTGRLFVALSNLRGYNASASWVNRVNATRINNIVLHGRSNYAALIPDIMNEAGSSSIYSYYVCSGYAAFWPQVAYVPGKILANILNAPPVTVNTNGTVTLPNAEISCEPLLHAVFELNISSSERSKLMNFTKQVYLAHEEYHNLTQKWVAFSEGNSEGQTFLYEWVIAPDVGSWKVTTIDKKIIEPYNTHPIIYSKVALSFLALYNTTYAKDLSVYIENSLPLPTIGWSDGADYTFAVEDRNLVTSVGSNTNGMILSAAAYFIQNNPS